MTVNPSDGGDKSPAGNAEPRFFHALPPHLQDVLKRAGTLREVPSGMALFNAGDTTAGLTIVLRGTVRLSRSNEQGRVIFNYDIATGDCFGELTFLDSSPHAFDSTAIDDAQVLIIEAPTVNGLLEAYPEFALACLKKLARGFSLAVTRFSDIITRSVENRLRRFLRKAVANGQKDVQITQRDLAMALSCSRLKVHRALGVLKARNIINVGYGKITILDADAL